MNCLLLSLLQEEIMVGVEARSNTHMVRKAAAHVFVMQNEVVRINCVRYFYHFDNKNDFSTNQPATKHLANVVKPR